MPPEKSTFRIIIAGGGVAGLTLANALERANIDYLLLEAGDQIAPPAGASIAVQPNGSRILDQIGALDDIYDASIPSTSVEEYKNGKFFNGNDLFRLQAAKWVICTGHVYGSFADW
jgi:2-polyprenyl-6-methoxyphenol hydroxylase-like FAD-dependent oxidoreductase